jgi:hypothetical protein
MNRLLGALKATYNFFSGDAITLTATIIAFIVCGLLAHFLHAPSLVIALVLIGAVVGSLVATLLREVSGRPRA